MEKKLNCDNCSLKNSVIYPCCEKTIEDEDGKYYCDNYKEGR